MQSQQRLVVQFEFAVCERPPQRDFERAPRLHTCVHGRLEEAIAAAAVGLGAVQRHVGVLQELVRLGSIVRCDRDADAGVEHHGVAVQCVGRLDGVTDAPGEAGNVDRPGDPGLYDGELVAADTRDGIDIADAAAQTAGDLLQELVADVMSERVVDAFEMVEIEVEEQAVRRDGCRRAPG